MLPLMMLLELCDIGDSDNDIKGPKSNVAPYFACLDVRNAVVPLTTLLASQYSFAGGSGVTRPKK